MRIYISHVFVDDQQKAQDFCTDVLGSQTKDDVPVGSDRWLTVVLPVEPSGPELLLEPDSHPAAILYCTAHV
jgi:hypothetical protein